MSGRIRTIKPEILEDTVTAGLSDMAHRIFIGIITLCEDSGRFRAEPGWLMGQIYWKRPVDPASFAEAIDELVAARLIVLYEASGQRYGVVRTWEKHQKISHRAAPRLPAPPWGDGEVPETLRKSSGDPPEDLRPDLRSPIPTTDPDLSEGAPSAPAAVEVPSKGPAPLRLAHPERGAPSADKAALDAVIGWYRTELARTHGKRDPIVDKQAGSGAKALLRRVDNDVGRAKQIITRALETPRGPTELHVISSRANDFDGPPTALAVNGSRTPGQRTGIHPNARGVDF